MARGATLAARWLHEPQPISNQPVGLGFPHRAGRYRPCGSPFSSPHCWSCRRMEGFLLQGWESVLPGVRWLIGRAPASRRLAGGAGFSHYAGQFQSGGSPFSSPGCRSCNCIEGFLIRGQEATVPGWKWLYSRAPANQRSAGGVAIFTPCGALSTPGITVFVRGLSELYMYGSICDPGMGTYPRRGTLALCTSLSQSAIGQWSWGTLRGGFDPGDHRFRHRVV